MASAISEYEWRLVAARANAIRASWFERVVRRATFDLVADQVGHKYELITIAETNVL